MKRPTLALAAALAIAALAGPAISHTPETAPIPDVAAMPDLDEVHASYKELVAEAVSGAEVAERGRAIVALQTAKDPSVDKVLQGLHDNGSEPMLIRTWAAAARVNRAQDFDALLALSTLPGSFPAVQRPFKMRMEALSGEVTDVETALLAVSRYPNLQQTMAPIILNARGDALTKAILTAKDQQVRYQATSYFGSKAQQVGADTVGATYVNAIQFRPKAETVPWDGGALYVPGIAWPQKEARGVIRELVAWQLWAERNTMPNERQQAINNLQSVGLQRAAGWNTSYYGTSLQILENFGNVAGKKELEKLLDEQGLADQKQFAALLGRVR